MALLAAIAICKVFFCLFVFPPSYVAAVFLLSLLGSSSDRFFSFLSLVHLAVVKGGFSLITYALSRAPLPSTRSTQPDAPCDGAGVKSGAVVAIVRSAQSGLAFRTEEIAIRQDGDGELRRVIESIRGVDGVGNSDWPRVWSPLQKGR